MKTIKGYAVFNKEAGLDNPQEQFVVYFMQTKEQMEARITSPNLTYKEVTISYEDTIS